MSLYHLYWSTVTDLAAAWAAASADRPALEMRRLPSVPIRAFFCFIRSTANCTMEQQQREEREREREREKM